MKSNSEGGSVLFLAEGQVPVSKCEELLAFDKIRGRVGESRATVVARFFVPGENKIISIFRADDLSQLLHALYRVPGITWSVKPIANLEDMSTVGSQLRQDCMALASPADKAAKS